MSYREDPRFMKWYNKYLDRRRASGRKISPALGGSTSQVVEAVVNDIAENAYAAYTEGLVSGRNDGIEECAELLEKQCAHLATEGSVHAATYALLLRSLKNGSEED